MLGDGVSDPGLVERSPDEEDALAPSEPGTDGGGMPDQVLSPEASSGV
jgi:hypothetical protein